MTPTGAGPTPSPSTDAVHRTPLSLQRPLSRRKRAPRPGRQPATCARPPALHQAGGEGPKWRRRGRRRVESAPRRDARTAAVRRSATCRTRAATRAFHGVCGPRGAGGLASSLTRVPAGTSRDEANLATNEAAKSATMVIDEPETPWASPPRELLEDDGTPLPHLARRWPTRPSALTPC